MVPTGSFTRGTSASLGDATAEHIREVAQSRPKRGLRNFDDGRLALAHCLGPQQPNLERSEYAFHDEKMTIRRSRVERYLNTIDAIALSPAVAHYRIGYTKRAAKLRADQYYATEWDHYVTLADQLSRDEALWLEETLQSEVRGSSKREILYRKFDPSIREDVYRRSVGGVSDGHDADPTHQVYMVWTEFRED